VVEPLSPRLRIFPTAIAAAEAAAQRVRELAASSRAHRGEFALAVSGGRTPEPMFTALASEGSGPGSWERWQLFWCDERLVAPDDPRSNFGLARRLWLRPGHFPPAQAHPVPTTGPAEEMAADYDQLLRKGRDGTVRHALDVVVLGVGPDGHTASLFPGSPTLACQDRWAVAEPRPTLPPHVPRVTLTLEALHHARVAIFLVCGADKREAVRRTLRATAEGAGAVLPAARVAPSESNEWFVDRDAAPPR